MSSDPMSDDYVFVRPDTDIHTWFNLTYANYLVVPRSVLQSMPEEWQFRFTELLDEMHHLYGHLDWPAYEVKALKRETEIIHPYVECDECAGRGWRPLEGTFSYAFAALMDESKRQVCEYCDGEGEIEEESRYETPEEVGYRTDPIPHYNRGRTMIPPKEAA